MIETRRILHVWYLLNENKYSQRKIAALAGVSRGTVQNIAAGKPLFRDTQEFEIQPQGDFIRCPQCGGKTRMPCTYCAISKVLESYPCTVSWNLPANGGFIDIELKGVELRRYKKIRKWRESQRDPNFSDIPDNWPWRDKIQKDEKTLFESPIKKSRTKKQPYRSREQ